MLLHFLFPFPLLDSSLRRADFPALLCRHQHRFFLLRNFFFKSLSRYLNQYAAASEEVKDITKKLISIEEELSIDFQEFLYRLTDYKFSYRSKISLIFDNEFVRTSKISTVFMKFAILINRF